MAQMETDVVISTLQEPIMATRKKSKLTLSNFLNQAELDSVLSGESIVLLNDAPVINMEQTVTDLDSVLVIPNLYGG